MKPAQSSSEVLIYPRRNVVRIVVVYVVAALIWIGVSDAILRYLFASGGAQVVTQWQSLKGTLFVVVTGILLYVMIRRFDLAGDRLESLFRTVFQNAGLGIALVGRDGVILEVNPALEKFYGYSRNELRGYSIGRYAVANDLPQMSRAFESLVEGAGGHFQVKIRYTRKDATVAWGNLTMSAVQLRDSRTGFVIVMVEDITGEQLARDQLTASEHKIRRFFESRLMGIAFWNHEKQITKANGTYLEMMGFTEADVAAGSLRADGLLPPNAEQARVGDSPSGIVTAQIEPFERDLARKDGTTLPVLIGKTDLSDGDSEGVAVVLDISALKKARERSSLLEQQLQQAGKLEAIGRLAGGIAHDMNNILGIVVGYTSLIQSSLSPDDPMRNDTEQVLKASENGRALVRQMLAFSRRQLVMPESLDIGQRVQSAVKMIRPVLGENIVLAIDCPSGLPPVEADPAQIDQVLLNLLLNARDAMPKGGKIVLKTQCVNLPESLWANDEDGRRPHVNISVTDTGVGMDGATQAQIFDPFFTTKEPGHGTGLGLSTVYGIVSQAGGHITVSSSVGQGTQFDVYLPVTSAPRPGITIPRKDSTPVLYRGTILLAEDRENLRRLFSECLRRAGFHVLQCEDGRHAVEVAEQYSGAIDLMVSDLGMPNLGGAEAASIILQQRPDMRVLCISGYVDRAVPVDYSGKEFPLLLKPFTPEAMLTKVRELLEKGSDQSSKAEPA